MKARWVVLISLVANIALVLAIGWTRKPVAQPLPEARTVQEVVVTQREAAVEADPAAVLQPSAVSFHWSQLVSDDLKLYRDRLREIGCPGRTVRQIILREIHDRFEPRRNAVLAGVQAQFWDLALQGGDAIEHACEKPLESLQMEQQKLIEEVLGAEEPEPAEAAAELSRANRRYDWLPEDKRKRMAAFDRKLNDAVQAMFQEARRANPDGKPTPEARKVMKALEAEMTAARKELLTPAEYEDYELRNSRAGDWASGLAGFEATEDEWRSVGRLIKQHDDAVRQVNRQFSGESFEKKALTEAVQKLNTELASARKEALGPERAAEVERASSGDYYQLRAVLQRYDMDTQLAARAYEIQQTAMKHANELRQDQNLPPEIREATLEAIRQETERTLAETLGNKAFATYQKHDRGWFKRLGNSGEAK
jgi:hypothetical protein